MAGLLRTPWMSVLECIYSHTQWHKHKQMPLPFLSFCCCLIAFLSSSVQQCQDLGKKGRVASAEEVQLQHWKEGRGRGCNDILLRQHFIANIVQFHFKRQSNFTWFLQAVRQTFDFSSESAKRFLTHFLQWEKLYKLAKIFLFLLPSYQVTYSSKNSSAFFNKWVVIIG